MSAVLCLPGLLSGLTSTLEPVVSAAKSSGGRVTLLARFMSDCLYAGGLPLPARVAAKNPNTACAAVAGAAASATPVEKRRYGEQKNKPMTADDDGHNAAVEPQVLMYMRNSEEDSLSKLLIPLIIQGT